MTAIQITRRDQLWSPAQRARLVRLCTAVVGDAAAAEDLAQEVDPLRLSVTLDDFATYELSLADTEALLSLTFGSLHAPTVAVPMEAAPRRIENVREISW